ncbi:unnamed protein product [Phytophthora fragariaefolia]|uniref:Unnamed protein product n=1 Tax=Phytophthora fragariaefolia TaxID=1490495 RepID=A0A9W7D651_9STRA|nr:unnamed protein product [Phytophthora fragariaefolia]
MSPNPTSLTNQEEEAGSSAGVIGRNLPASESESPAATRLFSKTRTLRDREYSKDTAVVSVQRSSSFPVHSPTVNQRLTSEIKQTLPAIRKPGGPVETYITDVLKIQRVLAESNDPIPDYKVSKLMFTNVMNVYPKITDDVTGRGIQTQEFTIHASRAELVSAEMTEPARAQHGGATSSGTGLPSGRPPLQANITKLGGKGKANAVASTMAIVVDQFPVLRLPIQQRRMWPRRSKTLAA